MGQAISAWMVDHSAMLIDVYIEALLVDKEAADQVWEAWNAHNSKNGAACIAWMTIAGLISPNDQHGDNREA